MLVLELRLQSIRSVNSTVQCTKKPSAFCVGIFFCVLYRLDMTVSPHNLREAPPL